MKNINIKHTLEEKFKSFDWFFEMSDDHRKWQKGSQQKKQLVDLGKLNPDNFKEIYYKLKPRGFEDSDFDNL